MRKLQTLVVTGGAGFIGSNLVRHLLSTGEYDGRIVNLDTLTYAGNPDNLADIADQYGSRYVFEKADILDHNAVRRILRQYDADAIIHLAAESHVDRSIYGPQEFVQTNVVGTAVLLEVARELWADRQDVLFHHVSTDEVFGSLPEASEARFTELTRYDPRSPYSASKAASDHLVRAYHETYGLPITITNCSNNYGPYQFPEKLIPLVILNILEGKPLPVYGDGTNIRDWLYVTDHAEAIWQVLRSGTSGSTYLVGGNSERQNIEVVELLCDTVARLRKQSNQETRSLITFVTDRLGHDRRYAIDAGFISDNLGWRPTVTFEEGVDRTVRWYMDNTAWIERVRTGEYRNWIDRNYSAR